MSLIGHAAVLADASSNLLAARNQMAFTLGFHIILACIGAAFPAIMLIAEYRGRKHGDADALRLAERWSKVSAVLFAVGAVTGTVLSFEMGLLWPEFMRHYGDVFGIAFGIEGIFFFLEAIFIAIYIYGWKRLEGWAHFWTGIPIVLSGLGGTAAVVAANSWMNEPSGFTERAGKITEVHTWEVLFNKASAYEIPHMFFAAYMVTGFLVASVYAVAMLRNDRRDRHHRLGLTIALTVAAVATPVQIFIGDIAAREVSHNQPAKFAAFECIYRSGPDQDEHVGGICTDDEVKWALPIPGFTSLLVGYSTSTEITGLDAVPDDEEPPAKTMLHTAFGTMVGIGFGLLALSAWFAIAAWRRRALPSSPWFLRGVAISGVAAVTALECGWIVTEVGRQPWIAYGLMRTEDAVTGAQGLWWIYGFTVALYSALGVASALILGRMSRAWREGAGA